MRPLKIIKAYHTAFFVVFLIVLFIFLVGIKQESEAKEKLPNFHKFMQLLEDKECHQAYHIIDKVLEETKYIEEGASEHEYFRLLDKTTTVCEKDWSKIFKDKTIKLEYKIDLVKYIDELYSE